MALDIVTLTKDELIKLEAVEIQKLAENINEFTKWKYLEAKAYFDFKMTQHQVARMGRKR